MVRYRLDVIAPCIVDAVASIGGWMFDRSMNGWDVHVFTSDDRDVRPLQILGAIAEPTLRLGTPATRAPDRTSNWAVATTAFTSDSQIRAGTLSTLKATAGRVVLWGSACPTELERSMTTVTYHLSAAAIAFKHQALHAANAQIATGYCPEMLFTAGEAVL